MPDMTSSSTKKHLALQPWACLRFALLRLSLVVVVLSLLTSCQMSSPEPVQKIHLHQAWELQPGDTIANRPVIGGLGDISIALNGNSVYAPFDGKARPNPQNCVLFSSPDLPAYLFRLCGLTSPRFGSLSRGDVIGSGALLQFAMLRKQPDGTWAIVEPSKQMLERTLTPP